MIIEGSFSKIYYFDEVNLPKISDNSKFHVKWIGKFANSDDFNYKPGLFEKFKNLIIGRNRLKLIKPNAIIAKDSSNLLILDQGLQAPLIINRANGDFDYLETDNIKSFPSLIAICNWKNDNVLFTDSKLNLIFKFNWVSGKLNVLNNNIQLNQPTGIGYSSKKDEIWVTETGNHRILILDSNGNIKKIIGKRGAGNSEFNYPTYITISDSGLVFIVDALNKRVQIFNEDGVFISLFGEAGDASGYFASPKGISVDSYCHIYVVDALFHNVQVFNRKGDFLYNLGSQGKGDAQFWMPSGIFIDKNDRIYVADCYNSRIQEFQLIREE